MNETIEIAVSTLLENNPSLTINRHQLKKLFNFATAQTHFSFNGDMYDQIDGVAMGSPLGPVLANLCMGHHEQRWISNYIGRKPVFYRRYVDDIFCLFDKYDDISSFLEYLNSRHPNIKFTVEYEIDGKIPFLDVLVNKTEGEKFSTSIFRKNTFTGLLMNFTSFCTISYKRGLVRTLVDRAFKINSSWPGFHCDLTKLTAILQRNQFPDHLLSNSIKTYLQEMLAKSVELSDRNVDERSVPYFKLPYVGFLSTLTHQRIRRPVESHCKGIVVMLVISSLKTGSYFSSKDLLSKYSVLYISLRVLDVMPAMLARPPDISTLELKNT